MKRLSPSSTTTAAADIAGFSLLPLPPALPPSDSKLRRCVSLPVESTDDVAGTQLLSPQPKGLPLLRTVSDSNSLLPHLSPPNHSLAAGSRVGGSKSPASGSDSPASKRLKRMSERMKEMKQMFDDLIQHSDQDCDSDTGYETEDGQDKNNVESEEGEEDEENTVSADRQGDAVNIRFNCPCGDSYHILLLGQDYYYKLM